MNRAILALPAALLVAGCGTASAASPHASSTDAAQSSNGWQGLGYSPSPVPAASSSSATANAAAIADEIKTAAWWDHGGRRDWRRLSSALVTVGADTSATPLNFPVIEAACARMQAAVTAMQALGPEPVRSVERWLRPALSHAYTSAVDCQEGIQQNDPALIYAMSRQAGMAARDMRKTTSALGAVNSAAG